MVESSSLGTVAQPLARNLRYWRKARGLTLAALADAAGLAKSTVALIERGEANPSIDTIWSLATALGIPFTSFFHDAEAASAVRVLRRTDAPIVATDVAGKRYGQGLRVEHLLTRSGGSLFEVYRETLDADAVRDALPHTPGLFEHILVTMGVVEISTASFCEVLADGDLISFAADRHHRYRAIQAPAIFVSIHEYPGITHDHPTITSVPSTLSVAPHAGSAPGVESHLQVHRRTVSQRRRAKEGND